MIDYVEFRASAGCRPADPVAELVEPLERWWLNSGAARSFRNDGAVMVHAEPGDGTQYLLSLVRMRNGREAVSVLVPYRTSYAFGDGLLPSRDVDCPVLGYIASKLQIPERHWVATLLVGTLVRLARETACR